ncbi:MAG TPA: nucleoside-diphosphate sugar epimerase, partial [Bacteroidia bacterium]|nr:nucleoside-diphosphate sugar epimerase [Bacteroidia bacterium]
HGSSSSEAFVLLKKGTKWYSEGVTGFVDARDVSAASILLMESDVVNQRFILCAANMTFRKFFDSFLAAIGNKPTRFRATRFLLGLGWRGEKLLAGLSGRVPRITKETAASALEKNFFKADKIERMTDFRYRNIDTSIKEIASFYKV